MEIPGFVKDSVPRNLSSTRVTVDIPDISVRGGIADENAREVMLIKLGSAFACTFNTYAGAESTEPREIWFLAVPPLERGGARRLKHTSIDDVGGMGNCR